MKGISMPITKTVLACLAGTVAFASIGGLRAATPDLDAAKAVIADHSSVPTFKPPGEPFDARSCMKGKKILTIPVSSANPFT